MPNNDYKIKKKYQQKKELQTNKSQQKLKVYWKPWMSRYSASFFWIPYFVVPENFFFSVMYRFCFVFFLFFAKLVLKLVLWGLKMWGCVCGCCCLWEMRLGCVLWEVYGLRVLSEGYEDGWSFVEKGFVNEGLVLFMLCVLRRGDYWRDKVVGGMKVRRVFVQRFKAEFSLFFDGLFLVVGRWNKFLKSFDKKFLSLFCFCPPLLLLGLHFIVD